MNAHRIETTLVEDRKLRLDDLPFAAGAVVEVIILERQASSAADPVDYPLRGKPVYYDRPFDPAVPEDDWDYSGDPARHAHVGVVDQR